VTQLHLSIWVFLLLFLDIRYDAFNLISVCRYTCAHEQVAAATHCLLMLMYYFLMSWILGNDNIQSEKQHTIRHK
jgi:hypothetical protein